MTHDPEVRARLLSLLRLGVPRRTAAAVAGVHASRLRRWMAGEPAFREQVEQAEAEAERLAAAQLVAHPAAVARLLRGRT